MVQKTVPSKAEEKVKQLAEMMDWQRRLMLVVKMVWMMIERTVDSTAEQMALLKAVMKVG